MKILPQSLALLFIVGILCIALPAAQRALPYRAPAGTDLASGSLARAFESHYDHVFPVRTFGTNLWAAFQLTLFGEGRPGVVVGRDGWLYTLEEFAVDAQADARVDHGLREIVALRDRLSVRGMHLVVALVPAKARLYPEHLGGARPAAVHRALYARALEWLHAAKVDTPDLLAALSRCKTAAPVFLRTDTHWTPQGAQCAAQALAGALDEDRLPPPAHAEVYRSAAGPPTIHAGDLLQFLPLEPYFGFLAPPPDRLAPLVTLAAASSAPGLLDETPAPDIALIGTSYSADEHWDFAGALRTALQRDLLNLSARGQGPFAPMRAFVDAPPRGVAIRLAIWEIPERYLPAAAAARPLTTTGGGPT